ncbi:MAG: hypothetical protein IJ176_01560 [Prevotella sp.]|nr:hypothetical protein [Prevotella sp.]
MNTLTLTDGAGTANATFEGTIQGKPFSNSVLICYVHDKNHLDGHLRQRERQGAVLRQRHRHVAVWWLQCECENVVDVE